jgi:aspartate-semialdehyde dehydrogenase
VVVSASCNRVTVRDSHTECVAVRLKDEASIDDIVEVLRSFQGRPQLLNLPSAPKRPVIVRDEPNRPQPVLDRDSERGMSSIVGRVRPCPIMGIKYVVLGHNTIRGAAGASILNAELFKVERFLPV